MNAAMRRNYVSDADEMRRAGIAAALAGVAIIGANIYEGQEAWKHAKKGGGWTYDPFMKQSTRPFMFTIGVTFTIGGTITALTN